MRKMPRNDVKRSSKIAKRLPAATKLTSTETPIQIPAAIIETAKALTATTCISTIVNNVNCLISEVQGCSESRNKYLTKCENFTSEKFLKSANNKNCNKEEDEQLEHQQQKLDELQNKSEFCGKLVGFEKRKENYTNNTTLGYSAFTDELLLSICGKREISTFVNIGLTTQSTLYPTVIETIEKLKASPNSAIRLHAETSVSSNSSNNNLQETSNKTQIQYSKSTTTSKLQVSSVFDSNTGRKQEQGEQDKKYYQQKEEQESEPLSNKESNIEKLSSPPKSSLSLTLSLTIATTTLSSSTTTVIAPIKTAPSALSQEVNARLATLRKRKANTVVPTTPKVVKSRKNLNIKSNQVGKQQRVQEPQLLLHERNLESQSKTFTADLNSSHNVGDVNVIESIKECDVKNTNKKRRRSHSTLSLKTAINTKRRKRRPTNNTSKNSSNNNTKGNTYSKNIDKNNSKNNDKNKHKDNDNDNDNCNNNSKVDSDKVNEINTTATESVLLDTSLNILKKKPRIMSLYDSRYQMSGSDGRNMIGNGYLTTGRTANTNSNSVALNDVNEGQDIANQYYLSNTSSVINNAQSVYISGNGSSNAANHAQSMAALCNIGNSCYLNSVVYTLRFAPQFLHNLHHLLTDLNAIQQIITRVKSKSSSLGRGINSGHMESARSWSSKDLASMEQYNNVASGNGLHQTVFTQKDSHQLLAEKLHELYQSLHRNEINESTEPHHADTLLRAIQDVSTIFEGNQQQDAHEFLMCILNSIRETSQTLIKTIVEYPEIILNGYISNPEDGLDNEERDPQNLKYSNTIANNNNNDGNVGTISSSAISALTTGKPSLFSRKSKRKEESKNSKNARIRSPLKESIASENLSGAAVTANSLFYLNSNDLNSSPITPTSQLTTLNSDEPNTSDSTITSPSILKDKQRLTDKIRELGLDFFSEDFEGITVSTTKCLSCETVTEQKETMIDIAVPVPQAGYELNETTNVRSNSFIQNSCITREYFRNENKYRCEQCTGYTEAIRSISYEVLPRLLVIQLSRFSGGMEKINSYVPTSFTLQCFCSKCCDLSEGKKLHIYKLYSVITHVGATMSVGHYIAYTCSLDSANEYLNCPKDLRRRSSQERNSNNLATSCIGSISTTNCTSQSGVDSIGSSIASSSTSFMKKMKFGRSKASSSGDMSKNVKHLNGLIGGGVSKVLTNGIGKLSINSGNNATGLGNNNLNQKSTTLGNNNQNQQQMMNTTCQGMNCCGMRICVQHQSNSASTGNNASEFSDDSNNYVNGCGYGVTGSSNNCNNNLHSHPHQYQHHHQLHNSTNSTTVTSGYGSIGRGASQKATSCGNNYANNGGEPIWYMCDDDKIKAMTQREFEELLSPTRKITVTPYLLFYARFDLQSIPPKTSVNNCGSNSTMTTSSSSTAGGSMKTSGNVLSTGGNETAVHTNSWSTESLQSGCSAVGGNSSTGVISGGITTGSMGLRL